ncbi:MAG: tRNA pseudouridine(55) synthase TruB [Desulfobacterales bacterium]|nr:tRNA pseudouridine(55) synthase TruB [Desulfobacterales bacterium]
MLNSMETGAPRGPATTDGGAAAEKPITAGVFLVDKPVGPTSFAMVRLVRRALGIKKVGHAGTLDPFASGLLVICAGRPATRLISCFMEGDKEYAATMRLGVETDTQDCEGRVVNQRPVPDLTLAAMHRCLAGFIGEQLQEPPCFSALKYKGKPLYYYARKGIEVKKEARRIEIKALDCLGLDKDTLAVRVVCSKGTYIRTLAADIGAALGCGAHLVALRRLRSGPFSVTAALDGAVLDNRIAAQQALARHLLTVDQVTELLK